MCAHMSMAWHIMEVRRQLVGTYVDPGKKSGISIWWQAPLPNEPSYPPIREFKTCKGFSFFSLSFFPPSFLPSFINC